MPKDAQLFKKCPKPQYIIDVYTNQVLAGRTTLVLVQCVIFWHSVIIIIERRGAFMATAMEKSLNATLVLESPEIGERYTSWGKSILNYFLVFVVTFFDIVQKENNHDTNQDELMLTRYKKYSKFNFSRALGCRRFRFLAFGGLDKLSFYES